MNSQTKESEVIALVSTILGRPVNRFASRDSEPTWDSLKHMEIIFAFEDQFATQLTEQEMAGVRSVDDLIALAVR
jgi:acyl carrier protein